MITQRLYNKATLRTPSKGSIFLVLALIALQLLACNGTRNQTKHMSKTGFILENANQNTFQELGFFGDIKENKWKDFLQAVKNNLADYEAQLESDHNKRLNAALKDFFVSNPLDNRWIVDDISQ